MNRTRPVRAMGATVVLIGVAALLIQLAQPVDAGAKPTSAPVFSSKSLAKAKVNVPFAFTIKAKANPVAAITELGPLPVGVTFSDNHNGTATLSGTEPLAGTYTIGLQAANGLGTAGQTLTLAGQGALLQNYYGTGHFSNDNYDAFVSGQPPNSSSQFDCSTFSEFATGSGQDAQGIQQGAGCIYPTAVKTVADQLGGEGLSTKGYMEDMGNVPTRESPTCGHPVPGGADPSFGAVPGDGYATRHDPFVYFHSIIDNTALCNQMVVPLGTTSGALPAGTPAGVTGLATDLASTATTPNLSFITPNLCNDGHDYPCTNEPTPSSSASGDVNSFLATWVPLITSSPAFQKDGLLEITFDEAESPSLDTTACCGETPGPAATAGGNGISGPGGGRVGAVLLSPFIAPGTVSKKTSFNHYSSLASIEDLFGLARLGEAKTVTTTFDKGIYKK